MTSLASSSWLRSRSVPVLQNLHAEVGMENLVLTYDFQWKRARSLSGIGRIFHALQERGRIPRAWPVAPLMGPPAWHGAPLRSGALE